MSKPTTVTFYMEGTQPLAYFNNVIAKFNGYRRDNRECYSHVGQHSMAAPEYVRRLRRAKPEEYAPLKQELESIGYTLKIRNNSTTT